MTMGLPFSHIAEHEVFPQTFLHKVEARFHYRSDDEDFCGKLSSFMEEIFGLQYEPSRFEAMALAPIRFAKSGDEVRCKITDDFFEVVFNHDGYISFQDSLLPLLAAFKVFFESVDANLRKVSLLKGNALPVAKTISTYASLDSMFSKSFMERQAEVRDFEDGDVNSTHRFISFADQEAGIQVKLLSSVDPVQNNDDVNAVSLQSLAVITHDISAAELTSEMDKLNDTLFDVFHWAIKPELIDMMRKEEKI